LCEANECHVSYRLALRKVINAAFIIRPVIAIQFDIGRQLSGLALADIVPVQSRNFHYIISQIRQSIGPPCRSVLLEGFPLDHALPLLVILEETELGGQVHPLQVDDRSLPGRIPLHIQSLQPLLHLIVLPPPSPERVGIAINTFHVFLREGDDATEVLAIVGVPIPNSRDVYRSRGVSRIPIAEVGHREQIDVVEYEHIVSGRMLLGSLQREVEPYVQQLPPVEFPTVIGLLDDVYVIIPYPARRDEAFEEELHVGDEFFEVPRPVLGGVYVAIGHDDGDRIQRPPFLPLPGAEAFGRHAFLRAPGIPRLRWRWKVPLGVPRLAVIIVGAMESRRDPAGPSLGNGDVGRVGGTVHGCCLLFSASAGPAHSKKNKIPRGRYRTYDIPVHIVDSIE
jgi:hypothetical protein